MAHALPYLGPSSKPHDTGVAVSAFVIKNSKLLLMKRKGGATGEGTWSMPGGGVEFMEDPLDAISRELQEETGIETNDFELIGYSNDVHEKEALHYVTFTFLTDKFKGKPRICEPNKCSDIGWFDLDNLPSPLFEPLARKLASFDVKEMINKRK